MYMALFKNNYNQGIHYKYNKEKYGFFIIHCTNSKLAEIVILAKK